MLDGTVFCNGDNGFSRLGVDPTIVSSSTIPNQVRNGSTALTDAVDIETGNRHTCAILSNGGMFCWGNDENGQLGFNDYDWDNEKIHLFALSGTRTCIVLQSNMKQIQCRGSAYCWGGNHRGGLGDGTRQGRDTIASPFTDIDDISCGPYATCFVKNGTPMCFGYNAFFQLGIANGGVDVLTPTGLDISFPTEEDIISIHVGWRTGAIVFRDNTVYSWGTNNFGALGDGSNDYEKVIGDKVGEVAVKMSFDFYISDYNSPSIEPSIEPSSMPSSQPSILDWIQIGQDIVGGSTYNYSGLSVSLSSDGSIVAIGTPHSDRNGLTDSGHVSVYRFDDAAGNWIKRGLDINGSSAGDYLGMSVSLSSDGSIVAIGAPFIDSNGLINSGRVSVYRFDDAAGNWIKRGLDIDGGATYEYTGRSLSLSSDGSIVAIGAPHSDSNGQTNSGRVSVYRFDDAAGNWIKRGLDIDDGGTYNYSGLSVSLSSDGSIVAIGAPGTDSNGLTDSGRVSVYRFDDAAGTWIKRGLDIDGSSEGDHMGISVSLSSDGSIVAIGAPYTDRNGLINSGRVNVYRFDDAAGTWIKRGLDIDDGGTDDNSGYSVSLSSDGSIVAIGAPGTDSNGQTNSGLVRVYHLLPKA